MNDKQTILVLCTGNSCRSQMAEGLINHELGATWQAFSAGTQPSGYVHPLAVRAMQELGIDISSGISKSTDLFRDLRPDLARPEIWRKFAKGERGRPVAPLGGIRDRSSLALTAGRMKTDPVFRDAAHHFLRKFDQTFAAFEEEASDSDLTDFANTRSARAFMLIGRVAGTFD